MSLDHERIEELLAGYVLLSLSGEEAIEADRLLSEHVPGCPLCRESLAGFQAVAGELSLTADEVLVPDLVLPRIHHGMAESPRRRRRGAQLVAVAASVAALVAMAGLSFSLSGRASRAEEQRGRALELLSAMQQPGVNPVNVPSRSGTQSGLVEVSGPTLEHMFIYGDHVPAPAPNHTYLVWVGSHGVFAPVANGRFLPEDGLVLLELTVDTSRYDEVWITEEPNGALPDAPNADSAHSWRSSLLG